jgi:dihydroflavonol-4-reductase
MAKVLVTGANGFLGHWVVRRLVEDGHSVRVLVRPTSDLSELEGLEFEKAYGDVTDPSTLSAPLSSIETVFHLAGVIAYRRSERTQMEKVNVGGTRNILAALEKSDVTQLVYLSSVVAVGAGFTPNEILNEESAYNLDHLDLGYFQTKHQAEILVRKAFEEKKVNPVILNPSTIYGAGDAKKGSRRTQVKVAQGKFPFYTKGGVNVIAVEDCVDGIMAGWKRGRSGERYILAADNLTIRELFETIAAEAGVEPPRILLPPWAVFTLGWIGDRMTDLGLDGGLSVENARTSQMYHWFDNSKAKRELGLNPRPSRQAIAASVRWMKEKGIIES